MARYRDRLPQLDGGLWLTDGGIETTLVFHDGLELPDFAAFVLLRSADGDAALRKYFRSYVAIARRLGLGLVLESATWRANPDWAARLGYDRNALADVHRASIRQLEAIRDEAGLATPLVISGALGPRGDGYVPGQTMTAGDAEAYHRDQIDTFAGTAADLVTGVTINYVEEAIGIVRAARRAGMPVVVSFTVETDGKLPTGQTLGDAIAEVDAATAGYAAYFMLNCAHPSHFAHALSGDAPWAPRLRGLRANASRKSHAELNESTTLDEGDAAELGRQYAELRRTGMPALTVVGGCCGTDDRHVAAIAEAMTGPAR
jgi:S-methylmethionine-dependent homocysteine/selenocysteine methylase